MQTAALLVGCGRFNAAAIQPLRFASSDATRMASCLTQFCGVAAPCILWDNAPEEALRPTQANILGRVRDLIENNIDARLERIYLFFSGHGVVSKADHKLYFVCNETDPRLLHRTALDLGELIDEVRVEGPAQIVVLLDTCRAVFTGGMKAATANEYLPFKPNSRFAAIVYSCAPGSASYESEPAKAGVFTEALLREMGEGGSCTTLGELRDRLAHTMAEVSRSAGKPPQIPFFSVEEGTGDQIVLVDKPTLLNRRRSSLLTGEARSPRTGRRPVPALVSGVIAIDLGTTKTLAAFPLAGGGMHLIRTSAGLALLETSVTLRPDLSYAVGTTHAEAAGSLRLRDLKRDTGRDREFRHQELTLKVTEAIGMVLNSVRRNIEEEIGGPTPPIVASYPVNFDTRQILQLRRAFELAGFTIIRMISEAAAATLALQTRFPEQAIQALVLDLGGGTFDVAVAELGDGVIEIKAVGGDRDLGGRDFDEVVHKMLNEAIETQNANYTDASSLPLVGSFDSRIEQVRFDLNAGKDAIVLIGERERLGGVVETCTATLRPADFADRCAPLLDRMRAAIFRVAAQERFPDTSSFIRPMIMLAGQGTRLALARRTVEQLFADIDIVDEFQENAVVTGLALQAAVLAGAIKSVLLLDVYHRIPGFFRIGVKQTDIPIIDHEGKPTGELHVIHLIGPVGSEQEFVPFLTEQTTVPTRRWKPLVAFVDHAADLVLAERDIAGDVEYELGTAHLKAPGKSDYWTLSLDIDANSSLYVTLVPVSQLTAVSLAYGNIARRLSPEQWLPITLDETSASADGSLVFNPASRLREWLEAH